MFVATLINDTNSRFFMPAVRPELVAVADVLVGAVDQETDTACGVLVAEAVKEEDGKTALAIRQIYVEESHRRQGAGSCMVRFLQDVAAESGVSAVICTISGNDRRMGKFLKKIGFYAETSVSSVYQFKLSDLELQPGKQSLMRKHFPELKDDEWKRLITEANKRTYAFEERSYYDQQVSSAACDKSGNVLGALLVSDWEDGLFIEDMFSYDGKNRTVCDELIRGFCENAAESHDPDSMVNLWVGEESEEADLFLELAKMSAEESDEIVTYTCETVINA